MFREKLVHTGAGVQLVRKLAAEGDRVFTTTDNGRLIALHRVTGQLLWESDILEGTKRTNYGSTSAPLIVKDMVIAAAGSTRSRPPTSKTSNSNGCSRLTTS